MAGEGEKKVVIPTTTTSGKKLVTLRPAPRMLSCFRMDGFLFARSSSFVRESAPLLASLRKLKGGLDTFADARIAIFGHSDYVGSLEYNKALSERRAEAVYALLVQDAGAWTRFYDEEKWKSDPAVAAALPDGPGGIAAYMKGILDRAGIPPIPADRFCGIWPKAQPTHPFMGCSEFNPMRTFSGPELKVHARDAAKCRADNEPNRRVVIYFFDKKAPPPFPCVHSSEGGAEKAAKNCLSSMPEYQAGKKYVENDRYKSRIVETFACPFYDGKVAAGCKSEQELPKPPQSAVAAIFIKGYELGLTHDKYLHEFVKTELDGAGAIRRVGLAWSFKRWISEQHGLLSAATPAGRQAAAERYRKVMADLDAKLRAATDAKRREEIQDEIDHYRDLAEELEDGVEQRELGLHGNEYLHRLAGSILMDMWLVGKLGEDGGAPEAGPAQPLPFRALDWSKAQLYESRGGAAKGLLGLRADALAALVADEPTHGASAATSLGEHWTRWAGDGRREVRAMLEGRSVPTEAPNLDPRFLPRATSGLATVGFEEQDAAPAGEGAAQLVAWAKACIGDQELPLPSGPAGNKAVERYAKVWRKRRENASHVRWRIYVHAAPSKKEWDESPEEAKALCKRRVEAIRDILLADPDLKGKVVSGFGGAPDSSWVPEGTAVDQVWKLARS